MSAPKSPADWRFGVGRITEAMFREHLFCSSGPESLSLMCGPPGMLENCAVPFLTAMGYAKERIITF